MTEEKKDKAKAKPKKTSNKYTRAGFVQAVRSAKKEK